MFDKDKKYTLTELYQAGLVSESIARYSEYITTYNKHRIDGCGKTESIERAAIDHDTSNKSIRRALNKFGKK